MKSIVCESCNSVTVSAIKSFGVDNSVVLFSILENLTNF